MNTSQRLLGAGAIANLLIGLVHVIAIFFGEAAARFFTAPPSILALVQQRSPLIYPIALGMLTIFIVFGGYAWSGAGFIRRLPLLRTGLLTVAAIFLLRGALLFPQLLFAWRHPGKLPPQVTLFSLCALLLGLAYLFGTIGRWRHLAPASPQA